MDKLDIGIAVLVFVLVTFAGGYAITQSNKRDAIERFNVCAEKIEPEKCIEFLNGGK